MTGKGDNKWFEEVCYILNKTNYKINNNTIKEVGFGSVIYAKKPGDGSAREQAASCQKVLGGWANITLEYATKRYRSEPNKLGHTTF